VLPSNSRWEEAGNEPLLPSVRKMMQSRLRAWDLAEDLLQQTQTVQELISQQQSLHAVRVDHILTI